MYDALIRVQKSGRWPYIVLVTCITISLVSFVTVIYPEYEVTLSRGWLAPYKINASAIPDEGLPSHIKLEAHHLGENVEAERLKGEVRVLCWVLTYPGAHQKKAKHVKLTWGKRCNKLIFMSSLDDPELGAVDLKVKDHYANLWSKSRAAFKYVYERYLNEYDWFFKADDDTYTIVENLRYMLSPYDTNTPIYFGCRFKPFSKQGFMSGGGGYILSREAVRLLVEVGIHNDTCKDHQTAQEDVQMGVCLDKIGVMAGDSRDNSGKGRFFPYDPSIHLKGHMPQWYIDYAYYKPAAGLNCCSDTPISFHYVGPDRMHELDYLLYHARPYGIVHNDPFPAYLPQDKKSIPKAVLEKYEKPSMVQKPSAKPSKAQKPSVKPSTVQKRSTKPSMVQKPSAKPSKAQKPSVKPSTVQIRSAKPSMVQKPSVKPSRHRKPRGPNSTVQNAIIKKATKNPENENM